MRKFMHKLLALILVITLASTSLVYAAGGEAPSIVKAEFEGLTRILVTLGTRAGEIDRNDIVIDNILSAGSTSSAKYWKLSAEEIRGVEVIPGEVNWWTQEQAPDTVAISLTNDALKGSGDTRGQMAEEACISIQGSAPVAIPRQGAALDEKVLNIIDGQNGEENDTSMWHNAGSNSEGWGNPYSIDRGENPENYLNVGSRYDYAGIDVNVLLMVFDFPDARGADNTGIIGLPGEAQVDLHNYVNGHRLTSAQDYFDWVSGRNKEFLETASFGNIRMKWELLENSQEGSNGIYTLPYSLYPSSYYMPGGVIYEADKQAGRDLSNIYEAYPWLLTNPGGRDYQHLEGGPALEDLLDSNGLWEGYWFARGASTDDWNDDVIGYAGVPGMKEDFVKKFGDPQAGTYTANFTMGYWAAVENAPGITYGQSFSGGDYSVAHNLGIELKNFSFMGADAYSRFKYKHMCHEFGHQIGLNDNYLDRPTGGVADIYTGTADYYTSSGGYDLMGYITGIAPDYFAWVKWKNAWFRDDQVVAVTDPGTYTVELTPVETEGGSKLIFIPGEDRGVVYAIEFRGGKIGVDNIEKTEMSNDPFDPDLSRYGEQSRWDHSEAFGTDTQAGILLYRFNANITSLDCAPIVVTDILPRSLNNAEGYDHRYSVTLNNSLLGPASGVYSWTDDAFGITISVDPGEELVNGSDEPYTVTVEKFDPSEKDRTPILHAQFVDLNAIQFQSDLDLRGLKDENFVVKKGSQRIPASVHHVSKSYVRLNFAGTPFTPDDITGVSGKNVTVQISAAGAENNSSSSSLYQYLPSDKVYVEPIQGRNGGMKTETVTLSELRFTGVNSLTAKADKDITGIGMAASDGASVAKNSLKITRADGTVLTASQIASASYSRTTGLLTVNLTQGTFESLSDTIGTTVEIVRPVSNFSPTISLNAVTDAQPSANAATLANMQWNHDVTFYTTQKAESALVATLSGGFTGALTEGKEQTAEVKVAGGNQAAPIMANITVTISGGS